MLEIERRKIQRTNSHESESKSLKGIRLLFVRGRKWKYLRLGHYQIIDKVMKSKYVRREYIRPISLVDCRMSPEGLVFPVCSWEVKRTKGGSYEMFHFVISKDCVIQKIALKQMSELIDVPALKML